MMNYLEELNLSTKVYKSLKAAGFDYVEELTEKTPTEMGHIRRFGSKAFLKFIIS